MTPLALPLALLLALPAAQDDEIERLTAWPELSRDEEKAVELDVERVRKANTPEMAEFAIEGLRGVGHGAGPALLEALGKEKDEKARARLATLLEEVTDARHTRLFAAEYEAKSAHVRVFALLRTAAYPDPGTRAGAEAALARLDALAEKESRKYDEDEHDAAALAATAAGSHAGLARVHALVLDDWSDRWKVLRAALQGARDAEATAFCAKVLEGDPDRKETVAVLNMLSGCGLADDAVPLVRPYLDDEDNSIRVAAINALRGIVDGDAPIEKLSVFDAIELAGEWKRRV